MKFPPRFTIVVLIAVFLLGILFFFSSNVSAPTDVKPRQAPEVSFLDYSGREVKLADFRGKATIINSWASWCPFCKEELRNLAIIQKEFEDKITIVAINRAEPLEIAKSYADSLGLTEKVVFLLDPADSFYRSMGGFSMPETIFVDKDGFIRDHKRGPMGPEEMRRRVEDAFSL